MRAVSAALCAALVFAALAATPAAAHKPRCKSAPKPTLTGSRRQDSDGITRTAGTNCRANGLECDLCCNGQCCEDVSSVSGAAFPTQHWVPMKFAYLTADPTSYNAAVGGLVAENLRTMNRVFAQQNLWFYSAGIVRYTDSRMIAACDTNGCNDPLTCDHNTYLMQRVRNDSSREIVVLVCDNLPYLGEASGPYTSIENSNQQYVTVDSSTVGTQGSYRGYTLVHEVGHYFGLFHTFHGCNANGDWVSDTIPAGDAATEDMACNHVLDTCPAMAGNDELNNYMNYAADACMTQFTAGQYARMNQNLRKYRPLLLGNTEAPTGTCPSTSAQLSDCACGNGNSPSSRCQTSNSAGSTNSAATTAAASSTSPGATTQSPIEGPPTPAPVAPSPASLTSLAFAAGVALLAATAAT